ncbi:hypothetical protein BPAE_0213g00110 [Botrytis paeoniae]|uniref:Uncharacterized protein n=1 Tax=Botrytis paeoniae TaxID=278948 RepID=A0A4Z1FAT6_9HELO|nr:hypothetical protein BPAE_0213g00110 [Botrytis paeoniae]
MFRRTLLRSGPPIIWRPHRVNLYRNMQSLPNLQQENAADVSPNHSGGRASPAPQDKTQDQTDSLLLNRPKENTLTNHGDSYDINSITVEEMVSKMESRLQKLESDSQLREQELDDIESRERKLAKDLRKLENYRDREYG